MYRTSSNKSALNVPIYRNELINGKEDGACRSKTYSVVSPWRLFQPPRAIRLADEDDLWAVVAFWAASLLFRTCWACRLISLAERPSDFDSDFDFESLLTNKKSCWDAGSPLRLFILHEAKTLDLHSSNSCGIGT